MSKPSNLMTKIFLDGNQPQIGEGLGAKEFTWGGLILDIMGEEQYG